MTNENDRSGRPVAGLSGPGIMLLSAVIFGYFGFFSFGFSYATRSATGQIVPTWVILPWTLQISAVAFALSAVITYVRPVPGNVLYASTGLVGAAAFLLVLVLDVLDKQHAAALSPILLLIFAAWNGYGSWLGLKAVMARG